jgi:hypothetical protein
LKKLISLFEQNARDFLLQRDGATAHTADAAVVPQTQTFSMGASLGVAFGHRDLRTLLHQDVFLRGCLEEKVYSSISRSLAEMTQNTERTVASVDPKTLQKVARNTLKKVDARLRE